MNAGDEAFRTTRWTRVMAARGESEDSKAALAELCEVYHAPVRSFIRHSWPGEDADDLTQAFFVRLLEGSSLDHVDRGRGRFRSYLLGAVKHFLRDHHVRESAEKRGGKAERVGFDSDSTDLATPAPADAVFDRDWALALIDQALEATEQGVSSPQHFAVLKPWLNGASPELSQSEAAAELGISEGAVKVAIHRLRKLFRNCVCNEIAQTVDGEDEIAAELNYLVEVLARES